MFIERCSSNALKTFLNSGTCFSYNMTQNTVFAVGFVFCQFERHFHFALQKPGLLRVMVVCLVQCLFGLCSAEGHT